MAPTGFTGIAVDSLIKILEGELISLASYYPCACIRVDDNDYVRALEYAPEEQQRPIPGTEGSVVISGTMANNNAWRKIWYINLTGLDTKAGVIFTDGMKLKVSIIFLPKIKEGSLDLTQWTALNAIGAVVNFRAYGCPEAVNKELELRRQYKPGLELKQISGAKNTGMFSAIFSKAESWEAETYYISLTVTDIKTAMSETNNADDSYVTFENSGTRQPEETTPGFELHDPLSRIVVVNLTAPLNGNYHYKWEIFIKKGSQKKVTNGGSGTWTAPTT